MMVDPSMNGGSVEIDNLGIGWGWASAVSSGQDQPQVPDFDASVSVFTNDGTPIVSGSVVDTAARVEVRPDGGDPIDIGLLPAPSVMDLHRSYFLSELPHLSSKTGEVIALDGQGGVLHRQSFDVSSTIVPGGCPPATGNPEGDPAATDCAPIPCPDTPVSSDDTSSSGDGNANVDCTVVAPPTCVEVPGSPGGDGGSNDTGATGCSVPPSVCSVDNTVDGARTIACGTPGYAGQGTDPTGGGGAPPATDCPNDPMNSCPAPPNAIGTKPPTTAP